jgi:hypothetical protein
MKGKKRVLRKAKNGVSAGGINVGGRIAGGLPGIE